MATKKKAATRTPAQLAYDKRRAKAKAAKAAPKKGTKRVVAKKVSPLKGRKLGPRKPKVETVVDQVQEDLTVTNAEQANYADSVGEAEDKIDRPDYFDQVEIIDLRGSDVRAIFALAVSLDARGFITTNTDELLNPKILDEIFHAQGLRLFHKNKLVGLVMDEDQITDSDAVSFPIVQMEAQVELTEPAPLVPNVIQRGGATYMRIG